MKLRITKITCNSSEHNKGCPSPDEPRVYFWPNGESIMENLSNRRERPYKAYKEVMNLIMAKMGISSRHGDKIRVQWSYRAGCPCRCSPGIILNNAVINNRRFDLHVDYDLVHQDEHTIDGPCMNFQETEVYHEQLRAEREAEKERKEARAEEIRMAIGGALVYTNPFCTNL